VVAYEVELEFHEARANKWLEGKGVYPFQSGHIAFVLRTGGEILVLKLSNAVHLFVVAVGRGLPIRLLPADYGES
jgi:hypothetical protein